VNVCDFLPPDLEKPRFGYEWTLAIGGLNPLLLLWLFGHRVLVAVASDVPNTECRTANGGGMYMKRHRSCFRIRIANGQTADGHCHGTLRTRTRGRADRIWIRSTSILSSGLLQRDAAPCYAHHHHPRYSPPSPSPNRPPRASQTSLKPEAHEKRGGCEGSGFRLGSTGFYWT
jgi:hypothetical protein